MGLLFLQPRLMFVLLDRVFRRLLLRLSSLGFSLLSAFLASLRLVVESFFLVEFLFANCKDEFFTAVLTNKYFVFHVFLLNVPAGTCEILTNWIIYFKKYFVNLHFSIKCKYKSISVRG